MLACMHAYFILSFIPVCCRGENFCNDFLLLGEIRSIIPSSTNVLALTTTASKVVFEAAVTTLHMRSPEVIAATPERPNIFLSVVWRRRKSLKWIRIFPVLSYHVKQVALQLFPRLWSFAGSKLKF